MKVVFHPEAGDEFQRAIETYQGESCDLGIRYYRSVFAALVRMQSYPRVWPRLYGAVRRCFVDEFPYKVYYAIEAERLLVVAVMHGKRKPDYWVERVVE